MVALVREDHHSDAAVCRRSIAEVGALLRRRGETAWRLVSRSLASAFGRAGRGGGKVAFRLVNFLLVVGAVLGRLGGVFRRRLGHGSEIAV